MKKDRMNRRVILLIVAAILVMGSIGFAYASAVNTSNGQESIHLPAPTQIKQASKELQDMVQAQFSLPAPVQLTEDEKIALYKEGFTLEDIGIAEMLAQEKHLTDIGDLLRNHKDEVKTYKNKIDQIKVEIKDKSQVLDPVVEKLWISKGFTKKEIYLAFGMANKMEMTLEQVLQAMKSGDIQFGEKLRQQGGKQNEK